MRVSDCYQNQLGIHQIQSIRSNVFGRKPKVSKRTKKMKMRISNAIIIWRNHFTRICNLSELTELVYCRLRTTSSCDLHIPRISDCAVPIYRVAINNNLCRRAYVQRAQSVWSHVVQEIQFIVNWFYYIYCMFSWKHRNYSGMLWERSTDFSLSRTFSPSWANALQSNVNKSKWEECAISSAQDECASFEVG